MQLKNLKKLFFLFFSTLYFSKVKTALSTRSRVIPSYQVIAVPRGLQACTHPPKEKRESNEGESERGEPSLDSRAL